MAAFINGGIIMIHTLKEIYGAEKAAAQAERYAAAAAEFEGMFGKKPERFFSAPGRTEVGGNHTDHNHGCVLAAGVSLDVIAAVVPTDDGIIRIKSQGFPMDTVDTADIAIKDDEENTSAALIRGVVAGLLRRGYKVGGFSAYTTSNVLKGSGLSSSAAFEVLVGTVLSGLYNEAAVTPVEIAQIAQFAENIYFGKPSGLMDQMASSVGSFITIDFADPKVPQIEAIDFDFSSSGHHLCIVDTKGNHADLTPEYAAIPTEMKAVAQFFGKSVLREVEKEQVMENLPALREKFGDRAVLRALHFFGDSERVGKEAAALKSHDFKKFLSLINESGNSSYKYLQNIYASSNPREQGLATALYLAADVLDGEGACRVHGGGFAGTIQAFVPDEKLMRFKRRMEKVFGEGSCYVLSIRPFGGTEVSL
jgi:galactokinase